MEADHRGLLAVSVPLYLFSITFILLDIMIVFLSMFRFNFGLTSCTVGNKNAYSSKRLVHDAVVQDWNQSKSMLS